MSTLGWACGVQDRLRDVTEENKKLLAERPEAYLLMSASIKKVGLLTNMDNINDV